jgi:alanine dehydrogenase
MPGAVPRTSAFALNNATLPFVMELADKGFERAMRENPHFAAGLNLHDGEIRHDGVAHALRAA